MEVVIWNNQNAQIRIFKILSKMGKFESIKMILEMRCMMLIKKKWWILKRERKPVDEWWMPESGLPDFTSWLVSSEERNEFGLPDKRIGFSILRQKKNFANPAFRIS